MTAAKKPKPAGKKSNTEDKPSNSRGSRGDDGGSKPPSGDGTDDSLPLGLYAERAYLSYAVSVVKGRALPDVCDGQKPVQRRILYAMNEMGLTAAAKPVKSARVVGDVLGKFHPHGDQSAYDAMVRLAQSFSMRYPLVDGHGNFGSRDGDSAAAMRYTEARLTPIASLLLSEIDQGTTDFVPNYDGAFQEPKLLPARLPMVLLNGASGIAVGMATEIPSHNLTEVAEAAVALIRKPKITVPELMSYIQGPDFPSGGQIISSEKNILDAYETGRGSLQVRARWKIEDLARGQWQVVVYELPPSTSSQKILEEIEELTNPKVKLGKKSLSQDQVQMKQRILAQLDTVRDESGKANPVRLVFEPKSSRQDQQEFINLLLAHTSMESSVPINMVMIGIDGRPRQKSLHDVLAEWVDFRFVTLTRRTQFRFDKVNDRIHILEGRLEVFLNIDKVIKIIRNSDEPKPALIKNFQLSDRQAEDILEIRLRQLAKLEGIKIEQELSELKKEKKELKELLDDEKAMRKLLIKEIESDAKTYGDDRRTLIEATERAVFTATVVDEPVTVIFSEKGWVRARTGHGHDPASFTFKEGDALSAIRECRTVDSAIFFDSKGRVYSLPVTQLPGARGDGAPAASLVDLQPGARISQMVVGKSEEKFVVSVSNGYGFTCKIGDMLGRTKSGKHFITMDENADVLKPAAFSGNDDSMLVALSENGRLLCFPLSELKELSSGGRGMIIMGVDEGEKMIGVAVTATQSITVIGNGRGGKAMTYLLQGDEFESHIGNRARKGKHIGAKIKALALTSEI